MRSRVILLASLFYNSPAPQFRTQKNWVRYSNHPSSSSRDESNSCRMICGGGGGEIFLQLEQAFGLHIRHSQSIGAEREVGERGQCRRAWSPRAKLTAPADRK